VLRLWLFWLPAIFLTLLCLARVDVALNLTGSGEANLGTWIYLFLIYPAMLLAMTVGTYDFPLTGPPVFIAVEALSLLLAGAAIDARRRRKPKTDV